MRRRNLLKTVLLLAVVALAAPSVRAQASPDRLYRLGHLSLTKLAVEMSERETLPALAVKMQRNGTPALTADNVLT